MTEKFAYTSVPNTLREFLKGIPSKAVPEKVTQNYLVSIGMKSTSDRSIIAVLKAVKLIDGSGIPTENYKLFRDASRGPTLLASLIKEAYADLYKVYEDAHSQIDSNLTNFFKAQSSLGERAIQYQIATFKVLCEFADFRNSSIVATSATQASTVSNQGHLPSFHVDLHIHLPDSKDPLVHDTIFQAIAKYIMKGASQ